ncbi:hypothetical protein [Rathayibacter sp. VKM Ac-2760]|uniref:hypothetical protein n=1 Tax=Rathayibacter sp. VKM Ac-2760 TaxID=2609253 RepID=UPI0013183065|nr:hypothetical protein [Rathayibacter sp. VKM Ac-2760]QHC61030.1 hypothetical protein GSU72_20095 [Rathayibacter sp. VKM Ac-2760]
MDVELLAVNAVNDVIARCPGLRSEIATNDKTPFTDGHIDLYSGERKKNTEWSGRVSVQVKGRKRAPSKRGVPKFSVTRASLYAYQRNRGVFYFYVAINSRTGDGTIYYSLLAPFAIQAILDAHPENQKELPIRLKLLPADKRQVRTLLSLAADAQRQDVETGFDPILFENMDSITIQSAEDIDFSVPASLSPATHDLTMTLNTRSGLAVPLGGVLQLLPGSYTERPFSASVRSGAETFSNVTTQRIDENTVRLRLSPGLEIVMVTSAGKLSATVHLNPENDLNSRLKSLNFFAGMLDNGFITIGNDRVPFAAEELPGDRSLREHLKGVTKLAELFDFLVVDKGLIKIDEVSAAEIDDLLRLRRALIDGEELELDTDILSLVQLPVGRWKVICLALQGKKPGYWKFIDPFSATDPQQFAWRAKSGNRTVMITAYDAIGEDDVATTLNLRLSNIVSSYQEVPKTSETHYLTNRSVLRLISAADLQEERREEFLDAAVELSAWLVAQDETNAASLVNYWQVLWRQGALTAEHIKSIRTLRRSMTSDSTDRAIETQFACSLLLNDREESVELKALLSEEQVAELQGWPIWQLYEAIFE